METTQLKQWYKKRFTKNDEEVQEALDLLMRSEDMFWAHLPQFTRSKDYNNRERRILPQGEIEELNVTGERVDSRRILIDKGSLEVYVTLCHYQPDSFYYVGRVGEFE